MKHLFAALILLLLALPTFAQQAPPAEKPSRDEPAPANPELAYAEKNVRQYGVQLNRLRESVEKQDMQSSQAFYVSILQTMRQTLSEADLLYPAPAAGIPESEYSEGQKRLFRQRTILESFEGFNFDFTKPKDIEEKLALMAEYQQIIQANLGVMRSK
ncbi:MAG: hypothetical protein IT270_13710 [Saprospiraceae bacterium]|nr:hypothetical protein [Saprospiraceae bacterium]